MLTLQLHQPRFLFTHALFLALLCLSATATAQPTDAATKEAGQRYTRGVTLYEAGNYEGALAEFEAAHHLTNRYEVLFNIGVTAKRLFRYEAAVQALRKYLADGGAAVSTERRAAVEHELGEIRQLTVEVTLDITPAGASVSIDGLRVGVAPFSAPVLLGPGKRSIIVEADGHTRVQRELALVSGGATTVTVALERTATSAHVEFNSTPPAATVHVDDRPLGVTPLVLQLEPGGHAVTFRLEGYEAERQELLLLAGQARTVTATLRPAELKWYQRWYVWALAGVLVAGAVTATVIATWPRPDLTLSYP